MVVGIKANELAENSDSFGLRLVAVLDFEGDFLPFPRLMWDNFIRKKLTKSFLLKQAESLGM